MKVLYLEKASFRVLLFTIVFVENSFTAPPDNCFLPFNRSDCKVKPTEVFYYYKPGSRCEVATWKGCPTLNKFDNQYDCVNQCVFRYHVARETTDECHTSLNTHKCTSEEKQVYTFDNENQLCVKATWRGCKTRNKFKNELECFKKCKSDKNWESELQKVSANEAFDLKTLLDNIISEYNEIDNDDAGLIQKLKVVKVNTSSTQTTTEPPTEPPTTETSTEPATESTVELSTEPTTELKMEPTTISRIEITTPSTTSSTAETTTQSTTELTTPSETSPTTETITTFTTESTTETTTPSTTSSTTQSTTPSTTTSTTESTTPSTTTSTTPPTTTSTTESTTQPTTSSTTTSTTESTTPTTQKLDGTPKSVEIPMY